LGVDLRGLPLVNEEQKCDSEEEYGSIYKHLVVPQMQQLRKAVAATIGTGNGKGHLR
jgi:hypothetical protein